MWQLVIQYLNRRGYLTPGHLEWPLFEIKMECIPLALKLNVKTGEGFCPDKVVHNTSCTGIVRTIMKLRYFPTRIFKRLIPIYV